MHRPGTSIIQNDRATLVPAFKDQEEVFSIAFGIIREAIANKTFPGAAVAVTGADRLVALQSFGRFVYPEDIEGPGSMASLGATFNNSEVSRDTLFDIASLTKPVATTSMAMILYQRGLLDLDTPLSGIVPEFLSDMTSDPRRRSVTVRMLLAHSSGLPAYEKLFLTARNRHELLQSAFITPLAADPGTRAEYSDVGFILLGTALERIARESLDAFCRREIFGPLAVTNTTFNPAPEMRASIPPTADERRDVCGEDGRANERTAASPNADLIKPRSTFRDRVIQGEVQDENAFVLGGVAGHAGLFSTAEDLARFAHAVLRGGGPILRQETILLFTARQSAPASTTRTLGWDTPSSPSQSGKYFGPRAFGHLGYTGTSLWIDPDRQLSITLLTNRTWPDCSNHSIKHLRPKFHDAIIEALDHLE